MTTTLTRSSTTLTLPDHLLWPNEFNWTATQANQQYSVGGALLVNTGTKLAGRPITLQGGADHGWAQRGQALTLRSWADDPASTMTLVYRGTTYSVRFAATEAPFTFTPKVDYSNPIDTDVGFFSLQLVTLS